VRPHGQTQQAQQSPHFWVAVIEKIRFIQRVLRVIEVAEPEAGPAG
jgi:hypothetical protein